MRSRDKGILALGIALGLSGCLPAPPSKPHDPDPPSPMTMTPASPTPEAPMNPSTPAACGAQTFPITTSVVAPNVYLLVDRSGSMSDGFGGTSTGTKWDAAQTAINGLLNANTGKAQWGLSLFPPNPSVDTCGKAGIDVPLMTGDEASVLSHINGLTNAMIANPRGSTPTADALATVRDSANLVATDRNNYVLLITDGIPECNNASDVTTTIGQLYNRTPSVKTFVVGIGADTASNPTLLNQWAEAGHTQRSGATEYYQASDAMSLITAFDAIIGATASCTYKLDMPPADPTLVVGQLNGTSIASDPANGFTYDAGTQSVTFHGAACDQITSGMVTNVGVQYGCPPSTIL
jgi:hypothetical protein